MDRVNDNQVGPGSVLPAQPASYDAAARFALGAPLRFPEFELTYLRTEIDAPYSTWVFRIEDSVSTSEVRVRTGGALYPVEFVASEGAFEVEIVCVDPCELTVTALRSA